MNMDYFVIKSLFANTAIIVSLLFLGKNLFAASALRLLSPFLNKLLRGAAYGALGIILMFFSIPLGDNSMFDFRHLAILLAGLYGGMTASLTAGVLVAVSRLFFFDEFTADSLLTCTGILTMSVMFGFLGKLSFPGARWKKALLMNLVSLVIISAILIAVTDMWWQVMVQIWVIGLISGGVVYHTSEYVNRFMELFKQMKEISTKDFHTGLYNVRQFDRTLNEWVGKSEDKKGAFSLLLLDIDHFKAVNDKYGHPAGDAVLSQFGQLLVQTLPSSEFIFRIGGEEFAVLMPDHTELQVLTAAEHILQSVENHRFRLPSGDLLNLTVSIGIAGRSWRLSTPGDMLQAADDALYRAKRTGRNKYCDSKSV